MSLLLLLPLLPLARLRTSSCPAAIPTLRIQRLPEKTIVIRDQQSIPQIFSTGNSAIDGGIIGLGLGALGAAVLGPTLNQVVSRPVPNIICQAQLLSLSLLSLLLLLVPNIIRRAQSSTGSVCTPDRLWSEEETSGWGGEVNFFFTPCTVFRNRREH